MSKEQDQPYQPQAKIIEHPARNPQEGFDRRVLIMDAKTGKVIKHQPYDLHIVGGTRYYEPKGSGNLFFESGEPAGRWVKGEDGKHFADTTKEHVAFEAKTEASAEEISQENESLKREIAALKAAQAPKNEKPAVLTPK